MQKLYKEIWIRGLDAWDVIKLICASCCSNGNGDDALQVALFQMALMRARPPLSASNPGAQEPAGPPGQVQPAHVTVDVRPHSQLQGQDEASSDNNDICHPGDPEPAHGHGQEQEEDIVRDLPDHEDDADDDVQQEQPTLQDQLEATQRELQHSRQELEAERHSHETSLQQLRLALLQLQTQQRLPGFLDNDDVQEAAP